MLAADFSGFNFDYVLALSGAGWSKNKKPGQHKDALVFEKNRAD